MAVTILRGRVELHLECGHREVRSKHGRRFSTKALCAACGGGQAVVTGPRSAPPLRPPSLAKIRPDVRRRVRALLAKVEAAIAAERAPIKPTQDDEDLPEVRRPVAAAPRPRPPKARP